MADCIVCGIEYDPKGPEKRRSGGLITHCAECSEETVARHAGVMSGEGKMASVQILQFNSQSDREVYLHYWKVNSGLYTGKSCQISKTASTPSIGFKINGTFASNPNHKGKS